MIVHKYPTVTEAQWPRVNYRLKEILEVSAYLAWTWYRDDLRVTAIFDPNHPGTTHSLYERYHRFVDVGLLSVGGRDGSERLRRTINTAYVHENPRLQTIPDLDHLGTLGGSTAPHFHFQVSPVWNLPRTP